MMTVHYVHEAGDIARCGCTPGQRTALGHQASMEMDPLVITCTGCRVGIARMFLPQTQAPLDDGICEAKLTNGARCPDKKAPSCFCREHDIQSALLCADVADLRKYLSIREKPYTAEDRTTASAGACQHLKRKKVGQAHVTAVQSFETDKKTTSMVVDVWVCDKCSKLDYGAVLAQSIKEG